MPSQLPLTPSTGQAAVVAGKRLDPQPGACRKITYHQVRVHIDRGGLPSAGKRTSSLKATWQHHIEQVRITNEKFALGTW